MSGLRDVGVAVAVVAAFGLLGAAGEVVRPQVHPPGGADSGWGQRSQASLFGEFRTSLSDYLLLKADQTHHRGADVSPSSESTPRPNARRSDWRGPIGKLQGEVEPFFDPAKDEHASARQAAALYWLASRADPHRIRLWLDGAFTLADGSRHVDEAIALLERGARENPSSIAIHTELARYRFVYRRQSAEAERSLRRAVAVARRVTRLDHIPREDAEARIHAYRWLALVLEDSGRPAEAIQIAEEGSRIFRRDQMLRKLIRRLKRGGAVPGFWLKGVKR